MTDIMTTKEAAEKWKITSRRVNELIRGGQIENAYKIGAAWVMPADTQKPSDMRIKNGKYIGAKAKCRERNAKRTKEKNGGGVD